MPLATPPLSAEAPESRAWRTVETESFLLVSTEGQSLLYVLALARQGERLWAQLDGGRRPDLPRSRVVLDPDRARTVWSGLGVDLAWGPETTRPEVQAALAQGWWERIWQAEGRAGVVPAWLVVTSAIEAETAWNPLFLDRLRRSGEVAGQEETPPLPLAAWFGSEIPPLAHWEEGRLLAKGLREAGVFSMLAQGNRGLSGLQSALRLPNRAALEGWWQLRLAEGRFAPVGPHWGLVDSRRQLEQLSTLLVMQRGLEGRAGLDALPALVGRPELSALLERRLAAIRTGLPAVHPVYHNAMASLGEVYELTNERQLQEAANARARFERDLAEANRLAVEIQRALGEPSI